MVVESRRADRLEELRELNRLFLAYAQRRARQGRPCMGLPPRVARQLVGAQPETLERLAELPAALFRLDLERSQRMRDRAPPEQTMDRMRLSLALTILNSAWHMARERGFEARMFLNLSKTSLRRLRTTPLSGIPELAYTPDLLRCAFAECRLTWLALFKQDEPEAERMLTLIALQPKVASISGVPNRAILAAPRAYR
ncbi:MAG: hypothetical protein GWN29_07235 [Gammaproteobacteria bacterium]|nr:hypothetical protein [Gammaproteobacteria bacterium]